MHDAGFENIAFGFNTVGYGMLTDKALPGLTQREFKSKYEFGIPTPHAGVDVPQRAAELATSYRNPREVNYDQESRMIAALQQYADCVRAAGYKIQSSERNRARYPAAFQGITGGVPVGTLSSDAKAILMELQGEERAIAVTSFDCEHQFIRPVEHALQGTG